MVAGSICIQPLYPASTAYELSVFADEIIRGEVVRKIKEKREKGIEVGKVIHETKGAKSFASQQDYIWPPSRSEGAGLL